MTSPLPHHENSDLRAGGGAGSGHMAAEIPLSSGSVFRPWKSDSCQARLSAVQWWGAGGQQWSEGHTGGLPGTAQAPAALQSPLASIPSEIWNCISVQRRREGEEVRGGREERMGERAGLR